MLQYHRMFLVVLLGSAAANAAGYSDRARIESIEGAKTAILQKGITLREASAGEEVRVGERIRTDGKTKVTLSYVDGSQVVVYPNSDLEIEKPKNGIQSNLLRGGDVKGSVEKEIPASITKGTTAPEGKPKIKFVIRTKSAVMGVRGTEFVAAYNAVSGLSSFHTLTGAVEVASSPAQLMGGSGVSVGGGQFVQATASGISGIQAFNPSTFLSTLGTAAGSTATSAVASAAVNGAVDGVLAVIPGGSSQPHPPAPPPKLPPPPPAAAVAPAVAEKNAADAEKERPKMHFVSFGVAAFMSESPTVEGALLPSGLPATRVTAVQFHWTPSIPLPVLDFLYARGSFGATVFERGSLNNAFLIHDYQLLAGTTILNPLFAEVGGGHQSWRSEQISGGILSANVGFILNANGRLNRLFVGVSKFLRGTSPVEVRGGIGIQLF